MSHVENKRINRSVVQSVKSHLGFMNEEQILFLKVAYAKTTPALLTMSNLCVQRNYTRGVSYG